MQDKKNKLTPQECKMLEKILLPYLPQGDIEIRLSTSGIKVIQIDKSVIGYTNK